MQWFQNYRKENNKYLPSQDKSNDDCILLSLVSKERLMFILERVLDESEFLSDGGIRALSKCYQQNPYSLDYGWYGIFYSIRSRRFNFGNVWR